MAVARALATEAEATAVATAVAMWEGVWMAAMVVVQAAEEAAAGLVGRMEAAVAACAVRSPHPSTSGFQGRCGAQPRS